jgi:hypothetical protein
MQVAAEPTLHRTQVENCPRCLQPVPPNASRCPACRQPVHSLRKWPLLIGATGLTGLLFVLLLMYQMVTNEDAANTPAPVDEPAIEQQAILPDPPTANTKPAEPSEPDKPPPLNER